MFSNLTLLSNLHISLSFFAALAISVATFQRGWVCHVEQRNALPPFALESSFAKLRRIQVISRGQTKSLQMAVC